MSEIKENIKNLRRQRIQLLDEISIKKNELKQLKIKDSQLDKLAWREWDKVTEEMRQKIHDKDMRVRNIPQLLIDCLDFGIELRASWLTENIKWANPVDTEICLQVLLDHGFITHLDEEHYQIDEDCLPYEEQTW